MLTMSEARSIKARQLYDFYRRKDGLALKTLDECYVIAAQLLETKKDLDYFNKKKLFNPGDGCVIWADGSKDPYIEKYKSVPKSAAKARTIEDGDAANVE